MAYTPHILQLNMAFGLAGGEMFDYESYDSTWKSRFKDFLRDNRRGLWRVGVALLSYFAIVLNLSCLTFRDPSDPFLNFLLTKVGLSLGLFFVGRHFYRSWEACNQLTAEEAMLVDPRPPIIYLRPFKADKVKFVTQEMRAQRGRQIRYRVASNGISAHLIAIVMSFIANAIKRWWARSNIGGAKGEAMLIDPLKTIGPVIAIGRPGERVPPLGAARVYVGDDWKDVVHESLSKAQLVLMFAGTTPSFLWEMTQIFDRERFVPTLIILPFFQRYSWEQAEKFASFFHEASGHELPVAFPTARAIFCPERQRMVLLWENPSEWELNFISPFLGPIAQAIESGRPGWTELLVKQAREGRRNFEQYV